MKLTVLNRGNLRVAALSAALLIMPVAAVELVGQPVANPASALLEQAVGANSAPAPMEPAVSVMNIDMPASMEMASHSHCDAIQPNALEPLVAMVAVITAILGVLILVIVLARFHYRDRARRAQNINLNIDKLLAAGRDIPIELLRGDELCSDDENGMSATQIIRDDVNLHKGIKNLCVGIGLLIFLTTLCGVEVGSVSFIVIGLGVSRLLVWKLSGVKSYSARTPS